MQDNAGIVKEKVAECMNKIFAFSLSRTNNTSEAEDLSQQIIVELLSSAGNLKDINAFYGWLWAVAKNVYGKYLRSLSKEKDTRYSGDFYELALPDKKASVEDELILAGDINLLKRELAILSRKYREAVVKYYLEDKSCAQISEELAVTVETVKHLLFKARKILKEGMNMNREFGEKSYKPGILLLDKWVNSGWMEMQKLTEMFEKRKLPGNILLSAYYEPLTIEEMSVELGVAAAYLEDEIKILLDAELIKLLQNGRYQTNIFIYTTACQEDIIIKTKDLYKKYAQKLSSFVDNKIVEVKEHIFTDNGFSENKLKWFISHFILWHSRIESQKDLDFPIIAGAKAFLWGYNHDYSEYNHGFNGIYGKNTSENYNGWVHISNYKLLEKSQVRVISNQKDIDFLLAAANNDWHKFKPEEIAQYFQKQFIEKDGNSYKLLCPVMTQVQYNKLCGICSDEIKEINSELSKMLSVISGVMENHAPKAVQSQIKDIALISGSFNDMANVIQNLCDMGYLTIPTQHDFLTIYAVI